jgi:glycerate kinase
MNILIAPSAFKHSLTANQVAQAIQRGLVRSGLNATTHLLPIADGGNGTLDAFLANGGTRHIAPVLDPLGRHINAEWGILPDGKTAIIEMALASGIELLTTDERNPQLASTYGTGQLMIHALNHGIERLIIGMGGSATVDGGAGCLMALGIQLLDADGVPIPHGGGNLSQLAQIDASALDPRWQNIEILIATDVENPTLGDDGAVAIFAPQKGASPAQIPALEANMTHFFTRVYEQIGVDVRHAVGGGAAGGFSAGLMAFLGGKIVSGITLLLEHNHFHDHLRSVNLVITGEGRMDMQTMYGKGAIGVARLAKEFGVPTVALVGDISADDSMLHEAGIHAVLPIIPYPMPLQTALDNASMLIEQTALRLGYLLQISPR